jgi:ubiquinone/menaquinone biosynthesis C-methylase UbiE
MLTGNALLDSPALLSTTGIDQGMTVADLGCGTLGHFTFPAAQMVGTEGKVYAVDILKSALTAIQSRVKVEGVGNVETVWADLEVPNGVRIPNATVDVVVLVNVVRLALKNRNVLEQIDRLLVPGGRLLAVDWAPGSGGIGPEDEHRVSQDEMFEVFTDYGFDVKNQFQAGPYHWGLVMQKIKPNL